MNKTKSYDKEIVTTPKNIEYMVQAVKGSLDKKEIEDLFKCSTDTELFKCLWTTPSAADILSLEEEFHGKSEVLAKSAREKGNDYFNKKSYISALQEYNTSIIQAPHNCCFEGGKKESVAEKIKVSDSLTELALAYGNRSATLFQLGRYKECMLDIQRALKLNYPSNSAYKLLHRHGSCHVKLRQFIDAKSNFEEALQIINGSEINIEDKTKHSWRKTLEKCLVELPVNETISKNESETTPNINPLEIPAMKSGVNEKVKESSDLIEFKKDSINQDAAFASNGMNVGDVLVVEKPYASVLFSARLKKQKCYNCFSNLPPNPLPCYNCSTISFCDESCRDSSYHKFHKFECNFFALFDEGTCADVGHLAIRVLMTLGVKRVLDYMKSCGKIDLKNGQVDKEGEIILDNSIQSAREILQDEITHCSIFDLEVGGSRKPSSVNNDEIIPLMELPFYSCFLMKLLHSTSFLSLSSDIKMKYFSPKDHSKLDAIPEEIEISNDDTDIKSEEDLFLIGGFLLRCLRIVRRYGKFIREAKKFGDDADKLTSSILGIGLYPNAIAKVQHSCDPTADIVHYNDVAVIRSIRKLCRGDEISISFGPLFHEIKLEPRRKLLWKANSVACCCVACYNKWPVLEEMFDEMPGYKCEKCRSILTASDKLDGKFLQCPVCKHKQNLEEIVESLRQSFDNYAMAMNDAMSGNHEGALPGLSGHLQLIQTHIRQPWPDLVACQTAVKLCYRLMANRAES